MAVPDEIRKVARPRNTIVVDRGGKGPKRYAVVERVGCKRVGKRNVPVNGRTVGHITDGRFVEKEVRANTDKPHANEGSVIGDVLQVRLSWGAVEVMRRAYERSGVLDGLLAVFDPKDAQDLLAVACLKVLRPDIVNSDLEEAYELSWLSEVLPGARLSVARVENLIAAIGCAWVPVSEYLVRRVRAVADGHRIVVGGVPVEVRDPTRGRRGLTRMAKTGDVGATLLYAFDGEDGRLVCSVWYPDDEADDELYDAFLGQCQIAGGLVVGHRVVRTEYGAHWLVARTYDDEVVTEPAAYEW